jgi:hypothetical protein
MSHSVIFCILVQILAIGISPCQKNRISPGSRLNALGVFHRFSNPLSLLKQNMPRMRKPSNDADDASKIGDDDAASISLALLMGLL